MLGWPPFFDPTAEQRHERTQPDHCEARVSYGIGRQLGDQLRENPVPGMTLDAVLAGLSDAFAGIDSRVSGEALSASFQVIRERMQAEAQAKAEAAAGEGRAYLAENAKREGVTVLPSGLQFEVLSTGEGAKPSREDTVRTHYHGTLIDGTVFDSSYQRGQPAEFPVGGVIAGWVEALQLMNAGSKWRLHVPSELAYGGQAVGSIPPHSVLVFDVELLEIL
ncbi:TPA: FKBP-type peptidyl-prolyl cis-trans isomerase [Pseudomonas aeruginosa]|nr:FKBP-type peptidyl-prolyl cis-trans isomerase [Pseudomonas aeruginosa]